MSGLLGRFWRWLRLGWPKTCPHCRLTHYEAQDIDCPCTWALRGGE